MAQVMQAPRKKLRVTVWGSVSGDKSRMATGALVPVSSADVPKQQVRGLI